MDVIYKENKKQKPAKKTTPTPLVAMNGKRTPEQLETESRFARAISGNHFQKMAEYVASLKRSGKLVDCSI